MGITQLKSRLNQNRKIIIVVSLLTMLMILFIGSTYSLLRQADELSERQQPYDIVVPVIGGNKDIHAGEIYKATGYNDSELMEMKTMDFLYAYSDDGFEDIILTIISSEQYYEHTGETLDIPEGKILELVMDESAPVNTVFPYNIIKLKFGSRSYEFDFSGEVLFLMSAGWKTIVEQSIGLNIWVVLISNFIFQLIYYVLSRRRIISRLERAPFI